jgi:hypothetical protein
METLNSCLKEVYPAVTCWFHMNGLICVVEFFNLLLENKGGCCNRTKSYHMKVGFAWKPRKMAIGSSLAMVQSKASLWLASFHGARFELLTELLFPDRQGFVHSFWLHGIHSCYCQAVAPRFTTSAVYQLVTPKPVSPSRESNPMLCQVRYCFLTFPYTYISSYRCRRYSVLSSLFLNLNMN